MTSPRNESLIDVADIASQRREAELDADQCEWTKLPEPLQPGQFALESSLASKVGLAPGEPVNADEFLELLMAAKGLGATRRSRKRDVRDFVWDAIMRTHSKQSDESKGRKM